jgi:hypothetical protein
MTRADRKEATAGRALRALDEWIGVQAPVRTARLEPHGMPARSVRLEPDPPQGRP